MSSWKDSVLKSCMKDNLIFAGTDNVTTSQSRRDVDLSRMLTPKPRKRHYRIINEDWNDFALSQPP